MIILAMLIGFIALISAINALFATLFGLSFQQYIPRAFQRNSVIHAASPALFPARCPAASG
jgi:hypothetical protein